jgi:hypothetical protein
MLSALPAVVPPPFLKAGLSFARSDMDVFGRIPSSTDIVTGFLCPVLASTIYASSQNTSNHANWSSYMASVGIA